ncbi:MAG: hypothetical protein K0Q79_2624 [Flavipsychrobacter sp.]|jgi:hypothetical protein|nr:hypothetical protein [Flavipsychrobacter sp.]
MKNLFLVAVLMMGTLMLRAQGDAAQGAKFKFVEEVHDFGIVKRGPVALYSFEFENSGDDPLLILDVRPSCSCTRVEWPKGPVKPGEKGAITLGVKTSELEGVFNKDVWIQSNAVNNPGGEKRYRLRIKGDARD